MELVLFHRSGEKDSGIYWENRLARLPCRESLELFQSIEGLAARLRRPASNLLIVILLAADRRELGDLLAMRHLLGKAKVFLMIADEEAATIALAHRLRPRYLGCLSDDFTELASVLGKTIQEYERLNPRAPSQL